MSAKRHLALVLLLTCEAAHAAGERRDPVAAEALFQQARNLMDAAQDAAACPKLEESQRLDPGVGTLMYLALCYERVGKTASAWSTYRVAASAARNARQLEREGIAKSRADALEPRLSRLVLRVPAQHAPGLTVMRDGVALGQAAWNVGVPVDPGTHHIAASALHYLPYAASVEVPPDGAQIVFEVPMLQPAAQAHEQVRHADPAPGSRTHPTAPVDTQGNRLGTQQWVGIGVGALGAVGFGLGTYFALRSRALDDKANQHRAPGTDIYDDYGFDLNQQALDHRDWARWSFVAGGVALAAGATLFLAAPSSNSAHGMVLRIRATSNPTFAALKLEGGWQ